MELHRHPVPRLPRASELHILPHGFPVTTAGMAICRQRPGTAKGHFFISLEDETGIPYLFVNVETFRANKLVIVSESFLMAEGRIQISEGISRRFTSRGFGRWVTWRRGTGRGRMISTEAARAGMRLDLIGNETASSPVFLFVGVVVKVLVPRALEEDRLGGGGGPATGAACRPDLRRPAAEEGSSLSYE